MKKLALVIACIVGCVTPSRLDADVLAGLTPRPGKRTTTFALIIGVNRSVNKKHPTLEFADDDALRFYGYFKEIGDKTYLLTRPDADSLKLHQGSKVTWAPTLEKLREKVTAIKRDIENRLDKQSPVELFIVFTGHGDVDSKGRGYLALEDAQLTAEDLRKEILDPLNASTFHRVHLIIDACKAHSTFNRRGPKKSSTTAITGGHAAFRFVYADMPNVGLLSATSAVDAATLESRELQAGVLSHSLLSGLAGAADTSGDGNVTYRELASFAQRSFNAIPNRHFRPTMFLRDPWSRKNNSTLVRIQ